MTTTSSLDILVESKQCLHYWYNALKQKGYHHGNLRRVLIDATLVLIAERGPHGFSLREAARRAGVSSGAPYRHFVDRDALLLAVAQEGAERLKAQTDEELARAGDNPLERFRAMGIAHVTFAVENPSYFRVMCMPEFSGESTDPDMRAEVDSHDAAIRSIVAASQREGSIYAHDPNVILLTARCLMYGLARMFVDGHLMTEGIGPAQTRAIAIAVTEVLGHGLIPRPYPEPKESEPG